MGRDPKLSLVGYCIGQDLGKLAASFPHMECFAEFFSVIDLQSVASVYNNSSKKPRGQRTPVMSSLQLMTAALLTKRLDGHNRFPIGRTVRYHSNKSTMLC